MVYSVTPNSEDDYPAEDESNPTFAESALRDLGVNVVDEEEDEDVRPFRLSDLAADYSTDSGPQSEPEETDDSRPVSRLGSSNSRTAYLDRSGGATSEDLAESTPEMLAGFRPKSSFREIKTYTPEAETVEEAEEEGEKEKLRMSDECLLSRR